MSTRSKLAAFILFVSVIVSFGSAQSVGEPLSPFLPGSLGESAGLRHLEDLKSLAADQGHIVVRVASGGISYRVFVLDDSDETMRIKSIHGPYTSQ